MALGPWGRSKSDCLNGVLSAHVDSTPPHLTPPTHTHPSNGTVMLGTLAAPPSAWDLVFIGEAWRMMEGRLNDPFSLFRPLSTRLPVPLIPSSNMLLALNPPRQFTAGACKAYKTREWTVCGCMGVCCVRLSCAAVSLFGTCWVLSISDTRDSMCAFNSNSSSTS